MKSFYKTPYTPAWQKWLAFAWLCIVAGSFVGFFFWSTWPIGIIIVAVMLMTVWASETWRNS